MNRISSTPRPERTLVQNLIAELTAVPVVDDTNPPRTLQIPRSCLLHEWMELYWTALERPEFLDWASTFDIDIDTLRLKGDTLEVQTSSNGTSGQRTFTLEDDSGWWQMAPMLLMISQRIDPAGFGLPYIGGKSANPRYQFPREVVLAFYGYPEPQNAIQTQVIVAELKLKGLAAFDENGNTTSAVVNERHAQLQDYQRLAATIDDVLLANEPDKKNFDPSSLADTLVPLTSCSWLATLGTSALKFEQIISRYELPLPHNIEDARTLAQRLRTHTWPALPYVSEYVQTNEHIWRYRKGFAEIEDCRHIIRRLEALSWNKAPSTKIDLEEHNDADPESPLGKLIADGQTELNTFRLNPAFQAILTAHKLSAETWLLVTESGHTGAPGTNGWVTLTAEVEKHPSLKNQRDRLKAMARKAGGALRSNGKVSLEQMLRFYDIATPKNVAAARAIALNEKSLLHMRPGHMNHWYLLGQPGKQTERFTAAQRQLIIATTQAYLPADAEPLIDYLSEGVDTDLPLTTLKAKADYLISRILITPRAHALGNQLLKKLAPPAQNKGLLASNRERLLLAALILDLDPLAGEHLDRIIGQPLNDSFLWGERCDEVRRFIDHQFDLARVRNKILATHLLLSGIAPEFLIRDIPATVNYMSSSHWVRLKQLVLYIENSTPGVARLMTFEQLLRLMKGPHTSSLRTFLRNNACASAALDWAVARGVIARDPEHPSTTYDEPALKQATVVFRNHERQLHRLQRRAFHGQFPTPATVALADLRKIFSEDFHLEEKVLYDPADPSNGDSTPPHHSLTELHLSGRLSADLHGWSSSSEQVKLASMKAQFARLNPVATLFQAALNSRLKRMKEACVAMIKEAFSQLPLAQRLDIEDNSLELLALQVLDSEKESATDVAPFAIIALLRGSTPRVFEIFTRRSIVTLRRDIDLERLTPSAQGEAARSLPFDAEAYRHGTRAKARATCHATIKRLDIEGAPLVQKVTAAVPDTFASHKVNAIARSAVRYLFDAHESQALQDALVAPELKDAEACHKKWLKFYADLSPPE